MNAVATATPPPRGIGDDVDAAMVGLVDRVDAERDPPDERREEERDQRRRDEGADEVRERRPGERA